MAAEKSFENKVKKFLKEQGCWFVKYWGGGIYTKTGIPDILVCCHGHFIGVEIKGPKGRPSALQICNLQEIDDAGGYAVLLYPDSFSDFKTMVELLNIDCTASCYYNKLKERWSKWSYLTAE